MEAVKSAFLAGRLHLAIPPPIIAILGFLLSLQGKRVSNAIDKRIQRPHYVEINKQQQ